MFQLSTEKLQFKKIKNIFKKLPKILVKHLFLTFLVGIFFSLFLGVVIFYQYSILEMKKVPQFTNELLKFDQRTYEIVLNKWQSRKERFLNVDLKKYPNPFILNGSF